MKMGLVKFQGDLFKTFSNNKPVLKAKQLKLRPVPQSSPENPQLLCHHAWRGVGQKAQTDWTQLDVNSQGELKPPPPCKNMDWPVLSKGGQIPFISSSKVAELPQQQRGEANVGGLLNYKRWTRVILLTESKEAGSDPRGMTFGCVVVNYIWASSWNLQHSGGKKKKSCQNRLVFILVHKSFEQGRRG